MITPEGVVGPHLSLFIDEFWSEGQQVYFILFYFDLLLLIYFIFKFAWQKIPLAFLIRLRLSPRDGPSRLYFLQVETRRNSLNELG